MNAINRIKTSCLRGKNVPRGKSKRYVSGYNSTIKRFVICNPRQILLSDENAWDNMGKAQGMLGREKCAKGFSGETCKKGATLKILA